MTTSTSTETPH